MPSGTSCELANGAGFSSPLNGELTAVTLADPKPAKMRRFIATAASTLAVICFSLGFIGSAFDEASAADLLLPIDTPEVISLSWLLDHVAWFALANLTAGAAIFAFSDGMTMRARVARPNRRRKHP